MFGTVFDLDELLHALVTATRDEETAVTAAQEHLERVMASPVEVADAVAPRDGGLRLLHHQPDLTVINVAWAPRMELMPHDHRMWALIAIYAGTEDNRFFRRGAHGALVESGGRRLDPGDVARLGASTIHAVSNPTDRLTGAIHVYGGDFVRQPRSQWGPGDMVERPYDMDDVNRQFRDANRAAGLGGAPGGDTTSP
jgi:predicted metal-dependent enzyme (double-stranded beta helix superfamily)